MSKNGSSADADAYDLAFDEAASECESRYADPENASNQLWRWFELFLDERQQDALAVISAELGTEVDALELIGGGIAVNGEERLRLVVGGTRRFALETVRGTISFGPNTPASQQVWEGAGLKGVWPRLLNPDDPVYSAINLLGFIRLARTELDSLARRPATPAQHIQFLRLGRFLARAEIGMSIPGLRSALETSRQRSAAQKRRGERPAKATVRRFYEWARQRRGTRKLGLRHLLEALADEDGAIEEVCYSRDEPAPLVPIRICEEEESVTFAPPGVSDPNHYTSLTFNTLSKYLSDFHGNPTSR